MQRNLLTLFLVLMFLLSSLLTACSLLPLYNIENNNMTAEQLCALSDAELNMAIITIIDDGGNAAEDKTILEALNKSKLTAYTIARFDMEEQNGGLCQYFTNSSRYTAEYLSDALILIGAVQTEKIFSEFITENNIDITDLSIFESDTHDKYMSNYESYPFNEFDSTFYDNYQTESLESLNAKFIRAHISDFIN